MELAMAIPAGDEHHTIQGKSLSAEIAAAIAHLEAA